MHGCTLDGNLGHKMQHCVFFSSRHNTEPDRMLITPIMTLSFTSSEMISLVLANDAEAVSRCMNPNSWGTFEVGLRFKNDFFAVEA